MEYKTKQNKVFQSFYNKFSNFIGILELFYKYLVCPSNHFPILSHKLHDFFQAIPYVYLSC